MAFTDFNNLPDAEPIDPPKETGTPDYVKAGESPPGTGVTDRANYIIDRMNKGFLDEAGQVDSATGQTSFLSPVSGRMVTSTAPAPGAAPDSFTQAIGSGGENMMHHPILSTVAPGLTFATGVTNELLKDAPAKVREGVGAALGLIGPAGLVHLAQNAAHLATGHFGGIGTLLHSLWSAPASPISVSATNALTRIAKSVAGEGLGSETPLSRADIQRQEAKPDAAKPAAATKADSSPSIAGKIANELYHWGGLMGLPSASDIVTNNQLAPW